MVNYKIHEVLPGIFAVEVKDDYERSMLFLRCQEHYESMFDEIRGNHFDIFKLMDLYRKWKGLEYFSYPYDWSGYNVPGHIVESCTQHVLDARNGISPTPYDYIMMEIIQDIKNNFGNPKKYYLIGVDELSGGILDHEISHGLFYVDPEYKKSVEDILGKMPAEVYSRMSEIILEMGYTESVVADEIQAYMSTGLVERMSKIKGVKEEAKKFSKNFKKHKKES